MPLHDWTDDRGWDSVRHYWITNLSLWLKPRLPSGFRADLGSVPGLTIETGVGRPDVAVRHWRPEAPAFASAAAPTAVATPDYRGIALAARDPQLAIQIVHEGRLVAAIELVSPRNKDRPAAREHYTNRYIGYVWDGVHLMLVDVHRRPEGFSFADAVAAALDYAQPPCPAPHAVSWNVGGVTPEGGRFLETWQRRLTVGATLPALPLALTAEQIITVELEATYAQAAADAYRE